MSHDLVRSLILTHVQRYPEMRLSDVYRLLHQSVFGTAEAVSKKKSTHDWLKHEFDLAAPLEPMTLLESISPDGSLVRLHLRPYRALGGKIAPLLEAIQNTAAAVKGSEAQIKERWEIFAEMAAHELAEKFPLHEVRLFGKVYEDRHWAVAQHSPEYLRAYKPLYRVLTFEEAQRLCAKQKIAVD